MGGKADPGAGGGLYGDLIRVLYSSHVAHSQGRKHILGVVDEVSLSVTETEERHLREAGFSQVQLTWEKRDESGHGLAVFVAGD
jgi:hypothetical protein